MAVVETPAGRQLLRFEADSQESAIRAGKSACERYTSAATVWAFARDGIIRDDGQPVDVISVDCWAPPMASPAVIMQRYRPASPTMPFALIGEMELVLDGKIIAGDTAAPALAVVRRGVASHSGVAPLLGKWE